MENTYRHFLQAEYRYNQKRRKTETIKSFTTDSGLLRGRSSRAKANSISKLLTT